MTTSPDNGTPSSRESHAGSRPRLPERLRSALVHQFRTWRVMRAGGRDPEIDGDAAWRVDSGGGHAGTRGAGPNGHRRLICSTGDLELILDVMMSKQDGCVDVLGQILIRTGDPSWPTGVELWQGHVNLFQTGASDSGEFHYRNIPEGDYSLYVAWPERGLLLAPASLTLEGH